MSATYNDRNIDFITYNLLISDSKLVDLAKTVSDLKLS